MVFCTPFCGVCAARSFDLCPNYLCSNCRWQCVLLLPGSFSLELPKYQTVLFTESARQDNLEWKSCRYNFWRKCTADNCFWTQVVHSVRWNFCSFILPRPVPVYKAFNLLREYSYILWYLWDSGCWNSRSSFLLHFVPSRHPFGPSQTNIIHRFWGCEMAVWVVLDGSKLVFLSIKVDHSVQRMISGSRLILWPIRSCTFLRSQNLYRDILHYFYEIKCGSS